MTEYLQTVDEITVEATADNTDPAGSETAAVTNETASPTGDSATEDTATQMGASSQEPFETQPTVFLPVYNGKVEPIDASDTARVTALLQKGMKFERMAGDLEKLHRLSAEYGTKSMSDLLDTMIHARDTATREAYIRQYGNEAGEKLFALEKERDSHRKTGFSQQDAAEDAASEEALHKRLAEEFCVLCAEYPTVTDIRDLPHEVIDRSLKEGISLIDAYSRYTLQQQQHAAAAAAQYAKNQQSSTGSLANGDRTGGDPIWEAFMRGVARRS